MIVRPATAFTPVLADAPSGLVGTLGIRIQDLNGIEVLARGTGGIIEDPAGSGIYMADRTSPAAAGEYLIVWDTGGGTPVFSVEALSVTVSGAPDLSFPGSLTLDGLKLRLDKQLDADDGLLTEYLQAAYEQAQHPFPNGCGRLLHPEPAGPGDDPVTRTIDVLGGRMIPIPDGRAITTVTADDTVVAPSDYRTVVLDDHIIGISVPDRIQRAEVTGRFGFESIPPDLCDAIYILAARSYHERAAQFADQVAIAEGAGVQAYYRQLPPRTKLVFASYAPPTGLTGLR